MASILSPTASKADMPYTLSPKWWQHKYIKYIKNKAWKRHTTEWIDSLPTHSPPLDSCGSSHRWGRDKRGESHWPLRWSLKEENIHQNTGMQDMVVHMVDQMSHLPDYNVICCSPGEVSALRSASYEGLHLVWSPLPVCVCEENGGQAKHYKQTQKSLSNLSKFSPSQQLWTSDILSVDL